MRPTGAAGRGPGGTSGGRVGRRGRRQESRAAPADCVRRRDGGHRPRTAPTARHGMRRRILNGCLGVEEHPLPSVVSPRSDPDGLSSVVAGMSPRSSRRRDRRQPAIGVAGQSPAPLMDGPVMGPQPLAVEAVGLLAQGQGPFGQGRVGELVQVLGGQPIHGRGQGGQPRRSPGWWAGPGWWGRIVFEFMGGTSQPHRPMQAPNQDCEGQFPGDLRPRTQPVEQLRQGQNGPDHRARRPHAARTPRPPRQATRMGPEPPRVLESGPVKGLEVIPDHQSTVPGDDTRPNRPPTHRNDRSSSARPAGSGTAPRSSGRPRRCFAALASAPPRPRRTPPCRRRPRPRWRSRRPAPPGRR